MAAAPHRPLALAARTLCFCQLRGLSWHSGRPRSLTASGAAAALKSHSDERNAGLAVASTRIAAGAGVGAVSLPAQQAGSSIHNDGPDEQPTAAYVHLPFCKKKCAYCDFPVIAVGQELAETQHVQDNMQQYVDLVLAEIAASQRLNLSGPLQTVFFGGGTPSLIALPMLEQLLSALERRFGLAAGAEVSIEADPGTFDAARLRSYMGMGVTRVSVGVQAFQDELLALCGRAHDTADVYRAVEAVHAASVPSWSLDLMSGLPQLTEEAWQCSLEQALDAAPHHVSTYDLQVEDHTPFARRYSPGEPPLPSDQAAAAMYCQASAVLGAAGYEHYEVSNYALSGHRCAHNMVYWEGRPFYGFGLGSASYLQGRRFSRPKRLNAYKSWVHQFGSDAERLGPQVPGYWMPRESADDRLLDHLMLRLRLADGLDISSLAAVHPQGGEAARAVLAALRPHMARGHVLASSSGGAGRGGGGSSSGGSSGSGEVAWVRLSDPQGFLLSNDIISDAFAALDITQQASSEEGQ